MTQDRHVPVIVGVGECLDRPVEVQEGLEPVELMARAVRSAQDDAGASLLAAVDSLDVVNLISWRYDDPAGLLCERLGITPARTAYGPVGGESPVRYLHRAAQRIAAGESTAALICGAESQHTVAKAAKLGRELPWTPFAVNAPDPLKGEDILHPLAVKLGCSQPVTVYPFYETATAAHWGLTPASAQRESGELWSRFSRQAADNPMAWLREAHSADEIVTPAPSNRLIAWPYTKLMVANPLVNQGAAVILTSLAEARRAGVAEDNIVFVWGGAHANEPRDYLARDHYWESHAQNAVLAACAEVADEGFTALELYSCFPCVPKMARRALGLPAAFEPTVTGGLTFFGAPLNNYMTHAACAMVRRLRASAADGLGLLYGQGEFVTKHHGLVLGRSRARRAMAQDASVQAIADGRRGEVPVIEWQPAGHGRIEAFTLIYERSGEIAHGVAIVHADHGARTLARIPSTDTRTLAVLTDTEVSPIGRSGVLQPTPEGYSDWSVAA